MNTYRVNAVIIGILLILCTAATILNIPFSGPILDKKDYLIRLVENKNQVIIGVLIELIWASTCACIAIGFYPILKKQNESLALSSVLFRIFEGIFVLIGSLSLLALLSLSHELTIAKTNFDSSFFENTGILLQEIRNWAQKVIVIILFCIGSLIYYYLLYQSKLIPRWLSGWGFIGAILCLVQTVYSTFSNTIGISTISTLLNVPIGVNEMVLAVWLIIKGFDSSAVSYLNAKEIKK